MYSFLFPSPVCRQAGGGAKTRLLPFIVALCALVITHEVHAFTPDDTVIDYARLMSPSVRVLADSKNGSGTVVASRQRKDGMWETDILTAKHVVTQRKIEPTDTGLVQTISITWWLFPSPSLEPVEFSQNATILKISMTHDLALLRMESRTKFPAVATIGRILAQRGDGVFAVGSPLGTLPIVTRGFVSILHYDIFGDTEQYLIADAPVWFGSSGGALYNKNYEVVGVTSAMLGSVPHIALFSHLESILEFMRSR